jgi:hypothetical protein
MREELEKRSRLDTTLYERPRFEPLLEVETELVDAAAALEVEALIEVVEGAAVVTGAATEVTAAMTEGNAATEVGAATEDTVAEDDATRVAKVVGISTDETAEVATGAGATWTTLLGTTAEDEETIGATLASDEMAVVLALTTATEVD